MLKTSTYAFWTVTVVGGIYLMYLADVSGWCVWLVCLGYQVINNQQAFEFEGLPINILKMKKELFPMKRKDKEISEVSQIKSIIEKAKVCRLGMANGDKPYVVPMSFGYQENALYFHGALKGQKIDFIKQNPNVCFEIDSIAEPLSSDDGCGWSMKFQSVIGFGTATFINDLEEKREALNIIMAQYTDKTFEFPENKINATAVITVEIERMTGKQSGF